MQQRKKLTAVFLVAAFILIFCGTGAGKAYAADISGTQANEQKESQSEGTKQEKGETLEKKEIDTSVLPVITEVKIAGTANYKPGDTVLAQVTVKNRSSKELNMYLADADATWIVEGTNRDREGVYGAEDYEQLAIAANQSAVISFKVKLSDIALNGKRTLESIEIYDETDEGYIGINRNASGGYDSYYVNGETFDIENKELSVKADYTVEGNESDDGISFEIERVTIDTSRVYQPGARIPVTIYFTNDTKNKKSKLRKIEIGFMAGNGDGENDWLEGDYREGDYVKNSDGSYTVYLIADAAKREGIYYLSYLTVGDEAYRYTYYSVHPDADYGETDEFANHSKVGTVSFTVRRAIMVSGISLNEISDKIAAGKKAVVTASVTPADATNKALTWASSNTKYATVDASGKVTFKKAGAGKSVTITATAADGSGKSASKTFRIMKHAVKNIKLKAAKTVKAGKKIRIKVTVKTTGKQANKKLKWTVNKPQYATVSSKGIVKINKQAKKGQKIKVTASATDGTGRKKSVTIKVK